MTSSIGDGDTMKRKRQEGDQHRAREPPSKRIRSVGKNYFNDLSDELVLRILSLLAVPEITKVERLSQRFRRLASDNEIWREKFYIRFVRPRARRIPTLNDLSRDERDNQALYYASKSAKWLEHHTPSGESITSDWKRRYKVKLNWTKGRCKARELCLDCPYQPRILVKICNGTIYTADEKKLRSYSSRGRPQILNTFYWDNGKKPTALSVEPREGITYIAIGFSDGSLEILIAHDDGSFSRLLQHNSTNKSPLTSLSMSWPYFLTMSSDHQLALLEISNLEGSDATISLATLANLRSEALLYPVSLSIRRTTHTLVASIAYSFRRLNGGWCIGLQEISLGLAGDVLGSRLTSTVDTPMHDFPLRKGTVSSRSASTTPFALHPNLMSPPTTLSHSGCYILAGLPDNTLMVYTVVSNPDKLDISAGRRLFGHTSSVAGAEVSDRGKALSISAKGDEIRVWELEDLLSSWTLQRTSTQLQPQYTSDDLTIALARRGIGLGLALKEVKDEQRWNRHWVGFDDEQVIVLGERDQSQILSCYDFA